MTAGTLDDMIRLQLVRAHTTYESSPLVCGVPGGVPGGGTGATTIGYHRSLCAISILDYGVESHGNAEGMRSYGISRAQSDSCGRHLRTAVHMSRHPARFGTPSIVF